MALKNSLSEKKLTKRDKVEIVDDYYTDYYEDLYYDDRDYNFYGVDEYYQFDPHGYIWVNSFNKVFYNSENIQSSDGEVYVDDEGTFYPESYAYDHTDKKIAFLCTLIKAQKNLKKEKKPENKKLNKMIEIYTERNPETVLKILDFIDYI